MRTRSLSYAVAILFTLTLCVIQTVNADQVTDDFLKKYNEELKKLDQDTGSSGSGGSGSSSAYQFTRDGIYGCQGLGQVGPVGLQHAQGTFVPVSEEAVALNTFILVNKFCVLDGLNIRQREALVAGITRAALKQVNEGRDGRAKYEQKYLLGKYKEIQDGAMEKFMEHDSLNSMCAQYKERVKRAVVQNYVDSTRKSFAAYQCSFSGSEEEMDQARKGDIESTGWGKWNETFNPNNDELSTFLTVRTAASNTIARAQEEYEKELDWGNGFLSDKECTQVPVGNGKYEEDCKIVTPGKVIADMTSFLVETGHRQTEQADSIDELVGSFITNLQTEVLANNGGLQSITNNANGDSYLDRAVGDAFTRAKGETTEVGTNALKSAIQTETDYVATLKTTLDLIDTVISQFRKKEDTCFDEMLKQAKIDLAKSVEAKVCDNGGMGGSCTADVKVEIKDDPKSTDDNPRQQYRITASIGTTKETVTLIKSNDKTAAVVKESIEPIRKAIAKQYSDAQTALTVLKGLENTLKQNNTGTTTQFVMSQFDRLVKAGKIHTAAHVSKAKDQQSQLRDLLQNLFDKTEKNWDGGWCKAEKWADLKLK